METSVMFAPRAVAPDTHVLPAFTPIPGLGLLPINAYLIRGEQPVLVDTGLPGLRDDFVRAVESLIDPADLRWIYLTHADFDHVGALAELLARAPRAKVVTTFLGLGKLGLQMPVTPDRVFLLNPGQSLDIGDRTLRALRPPVFDAPETTNFLDTRTGALFSSDCFGALLETPYADAAEVPTDALREGMIRWTTIDSPWLHGTTGDGFEKALSAVTQLAPSHLLGSHLPPTNASVRPLAENLRAARVADPFVGPDQATLEAMLGAVAAE